MTGWKPNWEFLWAPFSDKFPAGAQSVYWEGQISAKNSIKINDHTFNYLTELAEKEGVDIQLGMTVKALVMQDGAVVGVKAADGDGAEKFYRGSSAVLLTAGGFEMNRAMLKRYIGPMTQGFANVPCPPCNTGECIRMGIGAGADISGYGSTHCYDGGVWWKDYEEFETRMTAHVNKDGNQARAPTVAADQLRGERVPYLGATYRLPIRMRRRGDVTCHGLTDQAAVESVQPGGRTYVCFDSKYEELVMDELLRQGVCRVGRSFPTTIRWIDRVPDWQRDWRTGFQQMVDAGRGEEVRHHRGARGGAWPERGVLVSAVESGTPRARPARTRWKAFQYDPSWLIPIDEPPYYGAKIGGDIFHDEVRPADQPEHASGQHRGRRHCRPVRWLAHGRRRERRGQHRGHPFGGMYGDVGQSFVGGYMAAGAIVGEE